MTVEMSPTYGLSMRQRRGLMLAAMSLGFAVVQLDVSVVNVSGVAAGTLNTARQTGSSIGVALFGSLIAGALVAGLHQALAISIGLSVVVLVVARWVRTSAPPQR